jgi:hypothetical protein
MSWTRSNWTRALRQRLGKRLPAEHLLPESQPAYVRSTVYLFGALTIASLALVILFFMVLHLWGMFFQGAWRDGRGRTWVTGAIAFVVSIAAAFTGYLSQSNFDSQWIAVSAKDAINSIGAGNFFNVLNFGQMYTFHVYLLPLAVSGLVLLHILLVRLRGVVRPYPAKGERRARYTKGMTQEQYYRGVRMIPYDLVRELALMGALTLVVVLVLASAFGSPDEPPLTLQGVAQSDAVGFTTVSLSELAGNSTIAQYGPPYNSGDGSVQSVGPVSPQKIAGAGLPLDTAQAYVLGPLATVKDATVTAAVTTFTSASTDQQGKWEDAYAEALAQAIGTLDDQGHLKLASGDYGPLPVMFGALLDLARSGALDGLLLSDGRFYQTDYTKPLLFLNEKALPDRAGQLHLLGNQWGMMNETGMYPGQAWLWLYTFWYQVPVGPFNGPNADIAVWLTMAVLTAGLVFLPYIPGLNQLPRVLRVYRLIWRQHYRELRQQQADQVDQADQAAAEPVPVDAPVGTRPT